MKKLLLLAVIFIGLSAKSQQLVERAPIIDSDYIIIGQSPVSYKDSISNDLVRNVIFMQEILDIQDKLLATKSDEDDTSSTFLQLTELFIDAKNSADKDKKILESYEKDTPDIINN